MNLDFKSLFADLATTRYLVLSAITLYCYDWIIVGDEEILFLLPVRLSKGKVLYYFARIATLLGLLLVAFHVVNLRSRLTDTIYVDNRLLILSQLCRFHLDFLYPPSDIDIRQLLVIVVWFLYISLFATYLTSLGLLLHVLRLHSGSTVYLSTVNLCVPLDLPALFQGVFEVPLVHEFLLFGATVYSAWGDWREQRSGPLHAKTAPLLMIMYRDGVFYFCILVAIRVWNIYIFAARPTQEMYIGAYIMWSLITTLSSRIYLNIVREAQRPRFVPVGTNNAHAIATYTPHIPAFQIPTRITIGRDRGQVNRTPYKKGLGWGHSKVGYWINDDGRGDMGMQSYPIRYLVRPSKMVAMDDTMRRKLAPDRSPMPKFCLPAVRRDISRPFPTLSLAG
ncbi:hypothetical protein M408DRAFT_22258 [Serendipita vermifera MAFF 305830]|uniref:DUF6533 domain-containing protein n=1 Tax=Serendipita vermifera MAFF 305830 TaxID=933852 RepID=A0A0C3B0D9_SERVB|nr:hypothetical protein M408DRAFT_22258 [Serendipita vermifera MAFF 305830]